MIPRLACLALLTLAGTFAPTADASPDTVPLATAEARVVELARILKRTRATTRTVGAALAEVEEAYRHLARDPEPTEGNLDRWRADQDKRMERVRTRAEKLFLKALALKRVNRQLDLNEHHPIQFQAARALGRARPCVAEAFRRVLEKDVFGDSDYRKDPSFYDVSLRALASLGDPETFDWLLERGVNADVNDEDKQRALAALEVMLDLPVVTAEQRRATVRRLIDIYQSFAFHWQNKYDAVAGFRSGSRKFVKIGGVQGTYWMDVRPVVLAVLRRFSRDPRTGLPPRDPKTGLEWETLPDWLNWYHRVGRRGMPPWIDAPPRDPTGREGRARLVPQPPFLTVYEREFGVPWQRWWEGERRPPRRALGAAAAGVTSAAGEDPRRAFHEGLRTERLPTLFLEALESDHPEVRAAAALGLGKTRDASAQDRLRRVLTEEPHERVREAALLGLLVLRDASLTELFRDVVHDPEENARCRAYAVLALGHLGEGPRLWEVFGVRRPAIEGTTEVIADLQACAVAAVGLSGNPELAAPLMEVLGSNRWAEGTRGHVGTALARLGNPVVVPDLLRLLRNTVKDEEDAHLATAAAIALGALVPPEDTKSVRRVAAPILKPKGKYGGSRNALALALGRMGGKEAGKALQAAWEERAKDTTRYAELSFLMIALSRLRTTDSLALVRHQMRTLEHEHDLAATAMALATAGDRLGAALIRERTRTSKHILTSYGFLALGMLGDDDTGRLIRETIELRHEPALVRRALTALALLEGDNALPDLEAWWSWSRSREHLDAMAWAFVPAASAGAEALLGGWAKDESLEPRIRAFALIALGRMADPDPEPVLTRVGRDLNPYADTPTLSLLARDADIPFFR